MLAKPSRPLLIIADDIGIGPNTTTGILQLAANGIVTGSALLVNTPHAADAVRQLAAARLDPGNRLASQLDARFSAFPSRPGSQLDPIQRHLLAPRLVPQALVAWLARTGPDRTGASPATGALQHAGRPCPDVRELPSARRPVRAGRRDFAANSRRAAGEAIRPANSGALADAAGSARGEIETHVSRLAGTAA